MRRADIFLLELIYPEAFLYQLNMLDTFLFNLQWLIRKCPTTIELVKTMQADSIVGA